MPNVALAIRHSDPNRLCSYANRRFMEHMDIKEVVKEKYGQAALRAISGGSSCCGSSPSSTGSCDPITSNVYDASQAAQMREEALLTSLGLGSATAVATLDPGQ